MTIKLISQPKIDLSQYALKSELNGVIREEVHPGPLPSYPERAVPDGGSYNSFAVSAAAVCVDPRGFLWTINTLAHTNQIQKRSMDGQILETIEPFPPGWDIWKIDIDPVTMEMFCGVTNPNIPNPWPHYVAKIDLDAGTSELLFEHASSLYFLCCKNDDFWMGRTYLITDHSYPHYGFYIFSRGGAYTGETLKFTTGVTSYVSRGGVINKVNGDLITVRDTGVINYWTWRGDDSAHNTSGGLTTSLTNLRDVSQLYSNNDFVVLTLNAVHHIKYGG